MTGIAKALSQFFDAVESSKASEHAYIYLKKDLDIYDEEDDYSTHVMLSEIDLIESLNDINKSKEMQDRGCRLEYFEELQNGYLIKVSGMVGNYHDALLRKLSRNKNFGRYAKFLS